jgi:hypothetical protein
MIALFETGEAVNNAAGEDLREQVHRHLMRCPMLTAQEIARALNLACPRDAGRKRVQRQLVLMEDDGEAEKRPGWRDRGDHRPAVRWIAT